MLEIGIHDAKDGSVGSLPPIEDGSGKTPFTLAHQKANTRILPCNASDDVGGAIATIIIYYENLIGNADGIEHGPDMIEQAADIFCFLESGDYQSQLCL